jgi:hypothetical protein
MKRAFLLVAAVLLALPVAAQAGTKTYKVQPFERISVSAGIRLDATVGPAQSVVATTDGEDFSDLVVKVENGRLIIGRQPHWGWFGWRHGPNYRVSVSVPALHGLAASSAAAATVKGALTGDMIGLSTSSSGSANVAEVRGGAVALHASSSGRLNIAALKGGPVNMHASSSGNIAVKAFDGGAVTVHASSSGGVRAGGTCETLNVEASSGGRVRAGDLRCASVWAHASSGGAIGSNATKSFAGHASSGGHISVDGKPPQVQVEKSSGGSIDVGS